MQTAPGDRTGDPGRRPSLELRVTDQGTGTATGRDAAAAEVPARRSRVSLAAADRRARCSSPSGCAARRSRSRLTDPPPRSRGYTGASHPPGSRADPLPRPADGSPDAARRQRAHLPRIFRPHRAAPDHVEGRARVGRLRVHQHRAARVPGRRARPCRGRLRPARSRRSATSDSPSTRPRGRACPTRCASRSRRSAASSRPSGIPELRDGGLRGRRRHRHARRAGGGSGLRHDDPDRRPGHAPAGLGADEAARLAARRDRQHRRRTTWPGSTSAGGCVRTRCSTTRPSRATRRTTSRACPGWGRRRPPRSSGPTARSTRCTRPSTRSSPRSSATSSSTRRRSSSRAASSCASSRDLPVDARPRRDARRRVRPRRGHPDLPRVRVPHADRPAAAAPRRGAGGGRGAAARDRWRRRRGPGARRAAAPAPRRASGGDGLQLSLDFDSVGGVATLDDDRPARPRSPRATCRPRSRRRSRTRAGSRSATATGSTTSGRGWRPSRISRSRSSPRTRGRSTATPLAFAVAGQDGRTVVAAAPDAIDRLLDLVVESGKPLVGHEVKSVLTARFARRPGSAPLPVAFDTQIAAYVLNASLRSQAIADVAAERLDVQMPPPKDLDPATRAGLEALAAAAVRPLLERAMADDGARSALRRARAAADRRPRPDGGDRRRARPRDAGRPRARVRHRDRALRARGLRRGRPRVHDRVAQAARRGALRRAEAPVRPQDEDRLLDRRRRARGAAHGPPGHRAHPRLADVHEAPVDLCRGAARR